MVRILATSSELFLQGREGDYYAFNVGMDGRLRFARKGAHTRFPP